MRKSRAALLLLILIALAIFIVSGGWRKRPVTTQDTLDRQFQEMMQGVTLVGRSSRLTSDRISGEEKYVIDG